MLRFTENIIGQNTLGCNLRCKYCYESHAKKTLDYLDYKTFCQVFDNVLYYRCVLGDKNNRLIWHFHGGEVLMLPWEELKAEILYVEERKKYFPNIDWCIQTNGTLVTDEIAKFFVEHNHNIGFSFDGFGDNDRMSAEGNKKLIDNLRLLHQKYGTRFSCLSTFSRKNMRTWLSDMEKISDFCPSIGLNVLCDTSDEFIPNAEEQWTYWVEPVLKSLLTPNPIQERNVINVLERALQKNIYCSDFVEKTGCFDRICAFGSNMTSINPSLEMCGCDKHLDRGDFSEIDVLKKQSIYTRDFLGYQNAKRVINHIKNMYEIEKETGGHTCPASDCCPGDCQAYSYSRYGKVTLRKDLCEMYNKAYDFIEENWPIILEHTSVSLFGVEDSPKYITPYAHKKLKQMGYKLEIRNGWMRTIKINEGDK